MKTILLTAVLFLFAVTLFAQKKSDTLYVPTGTVKYIEIGDKVYKVITTLQEQPKVDSVYRQYFQSWPPNYSPATKLDVIKAAND